MFGVLLHCLCPKASIAFGSNVKAPKIEAIPSGIEDPNGPVRVGG